MKIAIASDHGGYQLKLKTIEYLTSKGFEMFDFGTHSEESCDYPDYAYPCAKAVANKEYDRGIVICGTGIGVSIVANKVKGIRCALANDPFSAQMAREHNDAHILAFGARVINEEQMKAIVDQFFDSSFAEGRHAQRLEKIALTEKKEG